MSVTVSTWKDGQPVNEVILVGQVVDQGSTYLGDGDSCYYVVYFDPETAEFKSHYTGYTPAAQISYDAPEDVKEAYRLMQEAKKAQGRAASALLKVQHRLQDEAIEAATPSRGKRVKVVKGRKVAKGTEGVVKVRHEGQYGWSVLLVTDEGAEHWTAESNVEIIAQSQEALQAA